LSIRASLAGAAVALSIFSGCATRVQPAVPLAPSSMTTHGTRIGVVMTPLPKVDTSLPGASCLLCLMAANIANSSLTTHAKTLPYEDLPKLKEAIAEMVRKRGAEPVIIDEPLRLDDLPKATAAGDNRATRDFSALQKKYQLDKLLLIDFTQLGFERSYSAYVPTSDPKGVLRGSGSLIDLKTQSLDWYQPVIQMRSAEGAWDEPPKFPGLTNAYFQVIELGKDQLLGPLKP
jgi:hypothetical protein